MSRGVTLIELLVVIVAVTVGVLILGSTFLTSARALQGTTDIQVAWQVAQECADHIIGRARKPGAYSTIPVGAAVSFCDAPAGGSLAAAPAGVTRTVQVTEYCPGGVVAGCGTPANAPACATTWSCKVVDINVTRGDYAARLRFMLVDA